MGFLGPAIGLGTSLIGGILGSGAAKHAAHALEEGSDQAISSIQQGQKSSQDFLNREYDSTTKNFNPYLSLGSTSANNLSALLGKGFVAPNPNDVASTPEYQFALK